MLSSAQRRLLLFAATFAFSMISCGREVTGPENGVQGPRSRVGALAVDPQMPSLMSSVIGGSQVVPFERVRVMLRREDGAVALDTIVLFPASADSLSLTLLVPLPLNAPAAGAPMSLTMAYINAQSDTVFRGGPQGITVAPVGSGPAPTPVAVPVRYDGVGRNAASVVIAPDTGTALAGSLSNFSAQALDAQAQPIAGTPLLFYTLDSARALVTSASTGAVGWLPVRGTARIVAALPDGARADTAFITVTLPASQLVIGSGDAQAAPLGTALGAPVVVRTLASDNLPVAGVVVTFAVLTGGGSLSVSTDTSDANGEVSTSWTLGTAFGLQTITATAAGLTGSPLTLSATATAGVPARLAVQAQPVAGVAGAPLAPAVVVGVEDTQGNLVTTFTGQVSISLPTLADATLGGTTTVNAVAGLATFSDLTIDVAGAYGLVASSETLVPDTTAAISIAPAAATHLKFTASPASGVAGAVLAPATTVVALDAFGNQATGFTGPVTLSLLGGAGTLGGTTTVGAVSGSASFGDLSVELIGDAYTLRAESGTLAADTSTAFGVAPAAVAALTLVAGDSQTASVGTPLAGAIAVRAEDAFGNRVPSAVVNFSVLTGGGVALPASTSADSAGVASTNWTLGPLQGTQTLRAALDALPGVFVDVSATATVGAATQLALIQQPVDSVAAGASITLEVEARDAFGNPVTTYAGTASVDYATNPTAAALGGTVTATFVAGRAVLAPRILQASAGYSLTVSSGTLSDATTATFTVVAAGAWQFFVFSGNNQVVEAGTAFPQPLQVRVLDEYSNPKIGHPTTWSANGVVTLGTSGTVLTDSLGIAVNSAVAATTAGPQSGGPSVTTSGHGSLIIFEHVVTAAAAQQLVFTSAAPGQQVAGAALPALVVEARDAFGNVATGFTDTVRALALRGISAQPQDSAFVSAVGGIATFTGFTILQAGSPYQIEFASGAFTTLTPQFDVVPAAPAILEAQPSAPTSGTAGSATAPASFRVAVSDGFGNRISGVPVLFRIVNATADTVSTTTVVTESIGQAEWSPVLPSTAGEYTVVALVDGLSGSPATFPITVLPGAPASMVIWDGDGQSEVVNQALPSQLAVRIADALGNGIGGLSVTWAVQSGDAAFGDTVTVTSPGGITNTIVFLGATAGSVSITATAAGVPGSPVTFSATATPDIPAVTAIVSGDGQTAQAGTAFAQPFVVRVEDIHGNPVPGTPVTFLPQTGAAAFTDTVVVTDAGGEAQTTAIASSTAGAGTIGTGVTGATPATFNVTVTAAAAFSLEYVAGAGQIDTVGRQLPDSLRVRVRDAFGNGVPGVAVAWSGIGGTPSADTTFTAATGDATVAYTFGTIASAPSASASVTGLSGSPVSMTFTALAASPVALVLVSAPDSVESGVVAPPFVVHARDAFGNVVSWFTGDVTATPTDAPDPSFAGGTATRAAVAGVASFDDLVFGTPGGWILEFATGALTVGANVVVIPGPATSFTIVSGNGQTGFATAVLGQPLVVRLLDGLGNPVVGDTVIFSVTAGGGTLANGLFADSAVTDANGDAQMTWTLGTDTTVTHLVEAAYPGFAPLQFSATATTLIASRVWSGDALNGSWNDAGNWVQGVAPTSSDSVLIPAGRTSYPTFADLSGSPVDVTRLTMEVGAALELDLSDLRVAGSLVVAAAGSITSTGGGVRLVGTGAHEVRGWVPLLETLSGAYVMTGDLSVDSDLSVSGGSLDVTTFALSVGRDLVTSASGALRMGAAAGVIVERHAILEGSGGASQLSGGTLTVRGNFTAGGNFAPAASHTVLLDGIGLQTVNFSAPDGVLGTTCFSSCFGRLVASKAPGDGGIAFATNAKARNDIVITADSVSATGRTLIAPIALVINTPVVSATKLVYADSLVLDASAAVDTLWAFSTGAPRPLVSVGTIPTRVVGNRTLSGTHAGAILVTSGTLGIDGPASVGADLATALSGTIQMTDASDTLVVAGAVTISGDGSSTMTDGVLVIQGDFVQQSIGAFVSAPAHRTVFAGSGSFSISFANPSFAAGQSQFGTLVLDHPSASSATLGSDVYASVLETRNGSAYTVGGANRTLVTRGATNVANVTFSGVRWEIQDTQPIVGPLSNLQFTAMDATISQLRVLRAGGTVQLQSPTFGTVPSGGAYLEVEDGNAGDSDSLTITVTSPIPEFHGGAVIQASGAQILGWPAAPSAWTLNSWTGAGGNALWSTAANWSQGRAPLPGDSVVIDLGGSYTVTLNTSATVTHLTMGETGTPTFSHAAGGTLTVDSTAFFGAGTTVLVQNGSELAGAGDIFVFGDLQFADGVMSGAGSTILLDGSTASFGTGGSVLLDDRALMIGGTATMGTGSLFAANAPLLYVLSTGDFAFTNDKYVSIGAAAPSVLVDGTLRIAAGASDTVDLEWPISGSGSVEIQSGNLILWNTTVLTSVNIAGGSQLYLRGESDLVGSTSVASGGTLRLGSGGLGSGTPGEHRIFGTVVGAGTVRSISAVRVAFEGGLDIDSLEVQNGSTEFNSLTDTMFVAKGAYLGGGFIRGDGVWAIRSRFSTNTGNLNGTGTIAVLPGATFSLRTPTRGWALDVGGTLQWGDWDLSFEQEPISLQYASMLVRGGGVFDILHGTATPRELFGTGSATPPHNLIQVLAGGTIRKSSGTGVSNIRPRVETAGLIEILSGSINVQGTCANTGSVTGTGSLSGNCGAFP